MRSPRTAILLVFAVMLLDVMGLTLLFPVGAFLVQRYSHDALMVALLQTSYAAGQFLAAPALGLLSDRFGRRPIILASVLGSAVGYAAFGIGGALWVLLLSRFVGGVAGGSISTATAYLADVSRPEDRARNFALVGLAWGVGLVVGPALGAAAGQVRLELPAFVAAGLSLLSAALCWLRLPESLPPERRDRSPFRLPSLNPLDSLWRALRRPGLLAPLLTLCLFQLGFQGIGATEGLYLIQRFAAQPWHLGALLVVVGVVMSLVQGLVVAPVVERHGEQRTLVAALWLHAGFALATFAAPSLPLAAPAVVLRNAAAGFTFPTLGAVVSMQGRDDEQGVLMGVTSALTSLMCAIGPVAAGSAHQRIFPGAGFWMGAVLAGAAAVVALRVRAPLARTVDGAPTAG